MTNSGRLANLPGNQPPSPLVTYIFVSSSLYIPLKYLPLKPLCFQNPFGYPWKIELTLHACGLQDKVVLL